MSRPMRQFIAFMFIAAFFVTAPILLFYTSGYRYSLDKQKVEKVGSFVLESDPKNAQVFLNGNETEYFTPARLINITPNEYEIKIFLPGYHEWRKTLSVKSQETTFAEDIVLFKKNPEKLILENNLEPETVRCSENNDFLLYTQNNNDLYSIVKLDINDDITENMLQGNEHLHVESLSPDSNKAVLKNQDNGSFKLLNFSGKRLEDLTVRTGLKINGVRWNDNSSLIINTEHIIFYYDITTGALTHLYENPDIIILDSLYENKLYYISQLSSDQENQAASSQSSLTELDVLNGDNKILSLPGPAFKIIDTAGGYLMLLQEEKNSLFLVSKKLDAVSFQTDDYQYHDYNREENKLLMLSNFELSVLDLKQYPADKELITRTSETISKALWNNPTSYIFYQQNNSIYTIELDKRNQRNIHELVKEDSIIDFFLDTDAENLIYITDSEKPLIEKINLRD